MGAPVTALSSASVTLAGNVTIGAGAGGRAGGALLGTLPFLATGSGGAVCGSSFELQLEIPNAANSDSTRTVKAIRGGVQSGFSVLSFFFTCISSR
jgi:hypothetical protein